MSRSIRLVGLVAGVVILSLTLPGRSASALCDAEEGLWVEKERPPVGLTAHGNGGTLEVRNRDLSTCDTGWDFDREAHSTTFLENSAQTRFVEIGWVEYQPGGSRIWRVFAEGHNGDGQCCSYGGLLNGIVIPAPSGSPDFRRFWLNNIRGDGQWRVHYSRDPDGVADWSQTSLPLNFSGGFAEGETGRRGGPNTGAQDRHKDLDFWNCSSLPGEPEVCTWRAWEDNQVHSDGICNWDWDFNYRDDYGTYKHGTC